MAQPRQERLNELLMQISNIFINNYEELFESEAFNKLLKHTDKECVIHISGLVLAIDVDEKIVDIGFDCSNIPSDDESNEHTSTESVPRLEITKKDHVFAKDLKVRLNEEDEYEIRSAYLSNNSPDISGPKANSTTDSAETIDARSIEDIVASFKTLALRLNLRSRKVWVKAFNDSRLSQQLRVRLYDDKRLEDKDYWRKKIQDIIDRIQEELQDAEDIKKLFILLEKLIKIAIKSQEK